ncbi:hypothetical protein BBJ41_21625 [Burkholderia stabilis]|nr:hypothetical protein BBJ41_21625 [Burkholderia stabilis]
MSRHIRQRARSAEPVAVACVLHACVLEFWIGLNRSCDRMQSVGCGRVSMQSTRRFEHASYLSAAKGIRLARRTVAIIRSGS